MNNPLSEETSAKVHEVLNDLENHFSNKKITFNQFVEDAVTHYINHIQMLYQFKK